MPQHNSHPLYGVILKLYPKAHRQEYGEQMMQTFDDMLSDQPDTSGKIGVWIRVGFELPRNIIEEHVQNIRGIDMSNKLTIRNIALSVVAVGFVVGAIVLFMSSRPGTFEPTVLSNVHKSPIAPRCVQDAAGGAEVKKTAGDDFSFIENNVVSSILDVPAGTNVDVHLKTYDSSNATGTAVYSGKFGSYNFTAKKTADNSTNAFVGGWQITKFETCRR